MSTFKLRFFVVVESCQFVSFFITTNFLIRNIWPENFKLMYSIPSIYYFFILPNGSMSILFRAHVLSFTLTNKQKLFCHIRLIGDSTKRSVECKQRKPPTNAKIQKSYHCVRSPFEWCKMYSTQIQKTKLHQPQDRLPSDRTLT